MSTPPLRRRLVAVATAALVPAALLVAAGGLPAAVAATAVTAAPDALDGTCATLQVFSGSSSQGYVVRNGNGYGFTSSAAGATPFRLEATQLSRYMLYDAGGAPAYMSVLNWVMPGTTYGDRADWTVAASGARYAVTATATGQRLGSYLWSLGAGGGTSTVALAAAAGCFTPPDVATGVTGTAAPGVDANGRIIGAIDAHMHVTAAAGFGGQLHCGEAWSPGGVVTALSGCATHGSLNVGAVLEGVLAGTDITSSPEDGWPTFGDWPQHNSELHEQAYFRSIERAYRSGVRVVDALLVTNRVICELFPYRDGSCDEMASVRAQAQYLRSMQDYVDAQNGGAGKGWFRIATTPAQVRSIAAQGRLAVLVGMEISEPFGCREVKGVPQCTAAQVDAGLDEMQALGVSGMFPVHKFDNAFGGTRMDGGVAGAAVNLGNLLSTGHWWEVRSCTGPADMAQPVTNDDLARLLSFGVMSLPAGAVLPVYPTGPTCNVRGLTPLGEHLLRQLMARGMVVHIDHMSVRTAQATLDILEAAHYPGVTSDHSWSDPAIVDRVLGLGGFVAGYAYPAGEAVVGQPTFVGEWRRTRALPHGSAITGYGFGSDVNGLADQAPPRVSSTTRPFAYPFTSLAGTTVSRHVMGRRTFDLNTDGVAQYGLYADWLLDVVLEAGADGPELRRELLGGAEAYTAMWERAVAW
ncbi:hypothetical protein [Kineosporia sp. A_224]|uniref:hypothetical protein n=1 Tax=Kineosporia sp. A_224 TaxID=1962180 RepID=UPI0013046C0B|nr:hypothetical protein [Kineosporia sp. A_224]